MSKRANKLCIIAKSWDSAFTYVKDENIDFATWRYILNRRSMIGLKNPRIVLVPEWEKHPDAPSIKAEMKRNGWKPLVDQVF